MEILGVLDGLLFTGGSDIDPQFYNQLPKKGLGRIDPKRDEHEIALAKKVLFEMDIPVLGICRGIQILNAACGGTLYQDLALERPEGFNHTIIEAPKHYPIHKVKIKEPSRFHHIFKSGEIKVNSFNHQGINRLASEFEATMVAEDGLIEGIEMKGSRFVIAVQWHPEMMVERHPEYLTIFEEFVKNCIIKEETGNGII
jgi:putative glutamine amidotransferase